MSWLPPVTLVALKGVRSILARPHIMALTYVDYDLYFGVCEAGGSRILYPEEDNSQAMAQNFVMNVQMQAIVG